MSAEQRRAQIIDVAIAEFARGGYSGTSTGAVGDARQRQIAREQKAKLFRFITSIEGVDAAMATDFLATGMLLNVLAALGIDYSADRRQLPAALAAWAERTAREGASTTRPAAADRLPGESGHSTSG